MKEYPQEHRAHLLNNLPQQLPPSIQSALTMALRENDREGYLAVLDRLKGWRACALCELPTHHTSTRRCDACWELDHRLDYFTFRLWNNTEAGREVLQRINTYQGKLLPKRALYPGPIIGQPVVTPDGFGKVVSFELHYIKVRNDIDDITRMWDANNVQYVRFELSPFTKD